MNDVKIDRIDDSTARVTVNAALPSVGASYTMTYTIYGSGDVIVESSYKPGSEKVAMMPRFGNELVAAPGLENITWYGRGPKETMIDRQFERIGVYTQHGRQGVGGVHAAAGERQQDRRPLGETDQRGRRRPDGRRRAAAQRHGAALHQGRSGARRLHVPDEAPSGDLSQSRLEGDGRRRHR